MKKYTWRNTLFVHIFFTLFFTTLLAPHNVNATSGSCSYHSGVACSLGSDYDGSVICNDGWRDSSVSFYDADECKIPTFSCPIPSGFKSDCGSITAQNARSGLLGSSFGETQLAQCEAQNREYDLAQEAYQECLNSQTEIQSQRLNNPYINNKIQDQNLDIEIQTKFNTYCESSQGLGSVWVNGLCKPTFSDLSSSCRSKMGPNATYEKLLGICACPEGYRISQNNQCVLIENNFHSQDTFKTQGVENKLIEKKIETGKEVSKLNFEKIILEESSTTKQDEVNVEPNIQKVETRGWFNSLIGNIRNFFSNLFYCNY